MGIGGSDSGSTGHGHGDTNGKGGIDQNQAPTSITLSNRFIKENQRTGLIVGDLSSLDPNATDTFVYTLVSGQGGADNAAFEIRDNQLITSRSFDYEAKKKNYQVLIRTTDPYSRTHDQSFTISIQNDKRDDRTGKDFDATRSGATHLGSLISSLTHQDAIGLSTRGKSRRGLSRRGTPRWVSDQSDFFTVTLGRQGNLSVGLSQLRGDVNLQVFNQAGTRIGSSKRKGNRSEQVTFNDLPRGDYFIQVAGGTRTHTRYLLSLNTIPVLLPPTQQNKTTIDIPAQKSSPIDPDGSISRAIDLGIVPSFDLTTSVFDSPTAALAATSDIGSVDNNYGRDSDDYFKINLTNQVNDLAISVSELTDDVDLRVYDRNFQQIAESTLGGTRADAIYLTNFGAGTYYVQVFTGTNKAQTGYKLSAIAGKAGAVDDNFANSINLGILDPIAGLAGSLMRDGAIDFVGDNDFYRFRAESFDSSGISIKLENLTSDVDLQVFNSAFELIKSSANGGTDSESILLDAAAGLKAGDIYYVRVKPYQDSLTNYRLQISTSSPQLPPPPQDPDGTPSNATDVGIVPSFDLTTSIYGTPTTPLTTTGDIGFTYGYGRDAHDYFKINLNTASDLAISIANLTADADLVIYDSNSTQLTSSSWGGSRADTVYLTNLAPGTYYADVTPWDAQTGYKLSAIAGVAGTIDDGFANSIDLGVLDPVADSPGTLIQWGSIESVGDNDFYRFRLESLNDNGILINLGNLGTDADLQVFNSAFERIGVGSNAGIYSESIHLDASTGLKTGDTYYVQVKPYQDNLTSYTLRILDATPLGTVPSFDLTTSIFGSPTAPLTTTGEVGYGYGSSRDTDDYFQVNLSETSDLAISISNLTADADLHIYDSNFNLIGSSSEGGSRADTAYLTNLAAGTYYADVVSWGDAQTGYKLAAIAGVTGTTDNGFANSITLGGLDPVTGSTGTLTSTDSIDFSGDNNFYRFTLESFYDSGISINLEGLTSDADLQVFNSAFERIGFGSNGGIISESIHLDASTGLKAGDIYYVQVKPFLDNTPSYTLNILG